MVETRKLGRYQGKVRMGLDPGGLQYSLGADTEFVKVRYEEDRIVLEGV